MKLNLIKPISAHGADMLELELRDPTGKDVQELGFPYIVLIHDEDQALQIQVKTVCKYISRLASIPPSSVDQLTAGDMSTLAGAVLSFFGVEASA